MSFHDNVSRKDDDDGEKFPTIVHCGNLEQLLSWIIKRMFA